MLRKIPGALNLISKRSICHSTGLLSKRLELLPKPLKLSERVIVPTGAKTEFEIDGTGNDMKLANQFIFKKPTSPLPSIEKELDSHVSTLKSKRS